MLDYVIRPLKKEEVYLLETFLYEAIFQRPGVERLPKHVILEPELWVYIDNFGKDTDHCLVAEYRSEIVGAVWTRILGGTISGFGHLDNQTPEFALSVLENFRGKGIGKKLMEQMINELKKSGFSQTSLAVQKDNYAVTLYQQLGFQIIDENDEEFIMLRKL